MIRHARLALALAVLSLPVAMIEPSLRTLLMAAIRATPLMKPCLLTAGEAAIALAAVTVGTEEEQGAALGAETKPLSQNQIARSAHVMSRAAPGQQRQLRGRLEPSCVW